MQMQSPLMISPTIITSQTIPFQKLSPPIIQPNLTTAVMATPQATEQRPETSEMPPQQTSKKKTKNTSKSPNSQPIISKMSATSNWSGHQSTIFAICYDDITEELLSSGKDSNLICWNKEGKVNLTFLTLSCIWMMENLTFLDQTKTYTCKTLLLLDGFKPEKQTTFHVWSEYNEWRHSCNSSIYERQ